MPCFSKLVAGSGVAMSGEAVANPISACVVVSSTLFSVCILATDSKKGLNSAGIFGCLIPIECILGKPYDAANLGDITQFRR